LGDCDHQRAEAMVVVAYEAHAGALSSAYFEEHARTLKKALGPRCEEWSSFSDVDKWDIDVRVVAHEFDMTPPGRKAFAAVEVDFELVLFSELVTKLRQTCERTAIREAFNKYVVDILNQSRTPQSVRETVKRLCAG